jgi:hypothetical protein
MFGGMPRFPFKDDDDDIDIPDFMKGFFGGHSVSTCDTVGCANKARPGRGLCIDCEVEANLPGLCAEIEGITQKDS